MDNENVNMLSLFNEMEKHTRTQSSLKGWIEGRKAEIKEKPICMCVCVCVSVALYFVSVLNIRS